jgi:hypothetical protein
MELKSRKEIKEDQKEFKKMCVKLLLRYLQINCTKPTHFFKSRDLFPGKPGQAMLLSSFLCIFHRNGRRLYISDSAKTYEIIWDNPISQNKKRFRAEKVTSLPINESLYIIKKDDKNELSFNFIN